jgi:hypothetical protein
LPPTSSPKPKLVITGSLGAEHVDGGSSGGGGSTAISECIRPADNRVG